VQFIGGLNFNQKYLELHKTEERLFESYDSEEQTILSDSRCLKVKYVLELSKDQFVKPKNCSCMEWRRAGIRLVLHYYGVEKNIASKLQQIFCENSFKNNSEFLSNNEWEKFHDNIKKDIELINKVISSCLFI